MQSQLCKNSYFCTSGKCCLSIGEDFLTQLQGLKVIFCLYLNVSILWSNRSEKSLITYSSLSCLRTLLQFCTRWQAVINVLQIKHTLFVIHFLLCGSATRKCCNLPLNIVFSLSLILLKKWEQQSFSNVEYILVLLNIWIISHLQTGL